VRLAPINLGGKKVIQKKNKYQKLKIGQVTEKKEQKREQLHKDGVMTRLGEKLLY
jgi:hypothetical protein